MLSWYLPHLWAIIWIIVVTKILGSDAASTLELLSNSSTSVPTSTTNSLDLITSCNPALATINPDYFVAPSLRTLPLAEKQKIINSIGQRIFSLYTTVAVLFAGGTVDDSASSYLNSVLSVVKNDATALFGPAGPALIQFNDIKTDPCLLATCFDQYFAQSSSFDIASRGGNFFYTASPPCCDRCKITAERVDVEYWPTPAPIPPVSTLIDEVNNVTFISPSAYARYTNLYAQDLCGRVGRSIPFTRLSFNPGELSTSNLPFREELVDVFPVFGVWTQVNYADFDSPNCICTTKCFVNPVNNLTSTYTCTPRISIPPQISALDPLWATCREDLFGFFDPPIALPRVKGLTGPKTTIVDSTPAGPNPTPTPTAPSPVDSPKPPVVTPTPIPDVVPEPVTTTPPVQESPANPVPSPSNTSLEPDIQNIPGPIQTTIEATTTIPLTVIGTQTFVLGPATTLTIEGSPVQISGTTIAAQDPEPNQANPTPATPSPNPRPVTINDQILTPDQNSNIVIGTQTLTPGGSAITVSGTVISLAPEVSELVVIGKPGTNTTKTLSLGAPSSSETPFVEFTSEGLKFGCSMTAVLFFVGVSVLGSWM